MVAPLVALAKAYAVNKAKDFATSKAEEALGLPKDTIGAVVNPAGFAKNVVKDVAKDYVKDSFLGRDAIPEEDRSFQSSDTKMQQLDTFADEDLNAYKRGGKVKSAAKSKANTASRRGDGIAQRGKTKGRYL
jgi:hypothetical protein